MNRRVALIALGLAILPAVLQFAPPLAILVGLSAMGTAMVALAMGVRRIRREGPRCGLTLGVEGVSLLALFVAMWTTSLSL